MSNESSTTETGAGHFWGSLLRFGMARQLQFFVALVAILAVGITTWTNYRLARAELLKSANERAISEVTDSARELDDLFLRIGMLPRAIATLQEAYGSTPDPEMTNFLRELMARTPPEDVYGLYIAYEKVDLCLAFHRKYWPSPTRWNTTTAPQAKNGIRGRKPRRLFFSQSHTSTKVPEIPAW